MPDPEDADERDDEGGETLMSEDEARVFFEERAFEVTEHEAKPLSLGLHGYIISLGCRVRSIQPRVRKNLGISPPGSDGIRTLSRSTKRRRSASYCLKCVHVRVRITAGVRAVIRVMVCYMFFVSPFIHSM